MNDRSSRPAIALTVGDPAGVGPELCVRVAARPRPADLVLIGSREQLERTARRLGVRLTTKAHGEGGPLEILDLPLAAPAVPGRLDPRNSPQVIETLKRGADGCARGEFAALVTAPVHKRAINDAGIRFTGHTEFLAGRTNTRTVVMMLVAGSLRVALATTHLPLNRVSEAITRDGLGDLIRVLDRDLRQRFGIARPRVLVCGLNPHAGEDGVLGREELEVIAPALESLRHQGFRLTGPVPADTAFTPPRLEDHDVVLAMYHDQGLPVLKYSGFGHAVNVTLGLPFIRTSVDHGTALDIAGRGVADPGSLEAALALAIELGARRDAASTA